MRLVFKVKRVLSNTLEQWNVIMYADVTLPLTLVSNKLNVPFFSMLFQWDQNCNCFQVHFLRNYAKIVSKCWKSYLTRLAHEPLSWSRLQFWFYLTTIHWQMLIKFAPEVPYLSHLGASWSPQNHSYPEKTFPSNVLISLEAEKKSSFTHWKSP